MKTLLVFLSLSTAVLSVRALGAEIATEVPVDSTRCNVRIGFGSSGFSRCFGDEVMIGVESVDPLRIRCGRLEVTCPTDAILNAPKTADPITMDTEGFEF